MIPELRVLGNLFPWASFASCFLASDAAVTAGWPGCARAVTFPHLPVTAASKYRGIWKLLLQDSGQRLPGDSRQQQEQASDKASMGGGWHWAAAWHIPEALAGVTVSPHSPATSSRGLGTGQVPVLGAAP